MAAVIDPNSYKYLWSRQIARKALDRDVSLIKQQLSRLEGPGLGQQLYDKIASVVEDGQVTNQELREIANMTKTLTFGKPPETDGVFKMGIVGSGAAGLFTAMIIDVLNERSKGKLNITYDLLEASGPKRLGGRLYTHRFTEDPLEHQYYDVGAMRFPKNEVMNRTFRLFNYLGMKMGTPKDGADLIPYYLDDDLKVCPTYFNDRRIFGPPHFKDKGTKDSGTEIDPYGVNQWLPEDDSNRIPKEVIEYKPGDTVDAAIEKLTDKLKGDLDRIKDKPDPMKGEPDPGWDLLNKADFMSARQFLRSTKIPELEAEGVVGPGYNFNTIEWLETYTLATGWYNQALSEVLLETLDFGPPKNLSPKENYFWCVNGGTQLVAKKMAAKLKKKPEYNRQVTAIVTDLKDKGDITLKIKTTPPDDWNIEEKFPSTTETRSYFTVFNATTLGALQRMDLSKANLLYGTKQAIRSLNYGASCKVGIQFKTMWWMKEPWNIKLGSVSKTDLPLRVCVYPSYNIDDNADKPGVLLCSYSWAQDAQRIGSLISPHSPKYETELKDLMLSNLAQLHANPDKGKPYEELLKFLHHQYKDHHAYDWYHDPNMAGAFAWFGPGQFSQMWPEIIKPNGWLYFIGEAASAHHGWIVGALESAVRAVYQLLHQLQYQIEEKGSTFDGYAEAMKFLVGNLDNHNDPEWELPFVGLPREMPFKQLGTGLKKVQETPQEGNDDLSFVAAQVIATFYEMVIQMAKEAPK